MSLSGKKILVDPGHGGTDNGASGTLNGATIYEKNLCLTFANSVKSYLEADGATVIMTRTSDTTVGINPRWQKGSDANVDAVISIHFNGGSSSSNGTETFYADTRSGDASFAQELQDAVVSVMGTTDRGIKDDTQSGLGSLGILRYPTNKSYPRALVEVEFITNPTAMENLDYPLYEASFDFAAGILQGFRNYFS